MNHFNILLNLFLQLSQCSLFFRSSFPFCTVLLLSFLGLTLNTDALSPQDLLLVYNQNVSQSQGVARYYAEKRGVPLSHLLGVNVPDTEAITWEDYEKDMLPAIRKSALALREDGLHPIILLVYGIPLRIQGLKYETIYQDFLVNIVAKTKEYSELVFKLVHELEIISKNSFLPQADINTGEIPAIDILKSAVKAYDSTLKSLTEKKQGDESKEKAKISSLLIRLGGTSPAVKSLIGNAAKEKEKLQRLMKNQELLQWDNLLRKELVELSFQGNPPNEVQDRSTLIRFLNGLIGELRFWIELEEIYKKPETSSALDNELSLLFREPYQKAKWLPNPYYDPYYRLPFIKDIRQNTPMVCRLDGPTPEIAKKLVNDAMGIEKNGLKGVFYIDARGYPVNEESNNSYARFDRHLAHLYDLVKQNTSFEVIIDRNPEVFPQGACPQAALYCGWYSLANYVDAFTWQKGAVGYHIASSEASTLKRPESNVWCKRMLEKGVTATLGPVLEPYLFSFPLPDHFFPLLLSGQSPLVEVYYRSLPFLSWRQILIGDPLYNPFKNNPAYNLKTNTIETVE